MRTLDNELVHEALVYSSDEEFLARSIPFLRDGIAAGQPVIVAVMADQAALLRKALGHDAQHVSFVDASTHYRRPARTIAEYRRQLDEALAGSQAQLVRVLGEVQFGSTRQEHEDWTRYESVVNRAFAGFPAWIVCGYDTRVLPEQVVADAQHTHPLVSSGGQPDRSAGYVETDEWIAPPVVLQRERAAVGPLARLTVTKERDLDDLRRVVAAAARAGGLAPVVADDVIVAVGELAREGLARSEGEANVTVLRNGARWHCEVSGIDDGVGLSIARLISERVEVSTDGGEQTVRLTFSGAPEARQRILDAASELFYQHGIRATGINTIISHSGVAKATFFRHFPGKDDLVVAWLEQPATRWFDRIRNELDAKRGSPASKLLAFFDLLGEWFGRDEFRGCAFQNAAAETPAAAHPVRQATQEYALEIRQYFQRTADDAELADPAGIAEQLHLLAQGAIATAVVTRSPRPARLARAAAERLI